MTKTTYKAAKLNGILDVFGIDARIYQKNHEWFIAIGKERYNWAGCEGLPVN